jgi:hypothetical protein
MCVRWKPVETTTFCLGSAAVDWTVKRDSRIGRLPAPLRYPALLARNLGVRPQPPYVYENDGIATVHHSPFLADREFGALYDEMASDWFVGYHADVRWRMWLLTRFARQCAGLGGDFAEFGVYRGGCAFMVLATARLEPGRKLYLFDTFEGIPEMQLTEHERSLHIGGELNDTSPEYVDRLLERWRGSYEVCPGDVFETFPATQTGPLAFMHVDLNASAPTLHVLEHAYERLIPGSVTVFDDYGQAGGADQREVIDGFYAGRPEEVIALPTSQGFVIKR